MLLQTRDRIVKRHYDKKKHCFDGYNLVGDLKVENAGVCGKRQNEPLGQVFLAKFCAAFHDNTRYKISHK